VTVHDDGDEWADDDLGGEWRADEPDVVGGGARPGGGPEVDPDHAAAVRTVRLVVAALVLAVIAAVAVWVSGSLEDDDEPAADDPTVLDGAEAVVGPPAGGAVEAYVAARRDVLADADGRRVAVVSLVSYRADTAVEDLLDAAGDVEVLLRLAALRGGEPTAVEGAVSSWVVDARSAIQAERDEIAALLPTIEDPADPFIAGYTEELAALDAQLAALDPAGELVFGVVVRADAGALRRLAERPEVRLVDVAPDDDLADPSRYRGLRPEELEVAGTPPTRPA
jgi:hypothetical protein